MNGWEDDKRWSDRFMPQIKGLLGHALIVDAPMIEDQQRNTDLRVLKMRDVEIAVRLRRAEYQCYRGQITMRSRRPSGMQTELAKVITGWGDYYWYGFAHAAEIAVEGWLIGDLDAFRIWHAREMHRNQGHPPGLVMRNHDRSADFTVYNAFAIPNFIVATDMQLAPPTTAPALASPRPNGSAAQPDLFER
jgi:hypothetical protein